jgi:hypothetical protein
VGRYRSDGAGMIPGVVAGQMILAGPSPSNYLDDLSPAPRVVYSLKKLISTATRAIRVRRSSDNAEQDIGFTEDTLDTAALAAFVGSDSAFVTTFYDQTATGINLVQGTAASQPRIVNAGVFDGAAIFDGVNDWMSAASVPFGTGYAAAYMKAAMPNQSAAAIMLESSSNYNSGSGRFVWYMENNLHSLGVRGAAAYRRDYSIPSATSLRTITNLYQMAVSDGTTTQQRFRVSGSNISPSASAGSAVNPVVNFTTQNLYLASRAGSSLYAPVQVETLVIYAADSDAALSDIESIVGA